MKYRLENADVIWRVKDGELNVTRPRPTQEKCQYCGVTLAKHTRPPDGKMCYFVEGAVSEYDLPSHFKEGVGRIDYEEVKGKVNLSLTPHSRDTVIQIGGGDPRISERVNDEQEPQPWTCDRHLTPVEQIPVGESCPVCQHFQVKK